MTFSQASLRRSAVVVSFVSLALVVGASASACSSSATPGDGDASTPTDASTQTDTSTPTDKDASATPDSSTPDAATPGNCTNNGFVSVATDGIAKSDGSVLIAGQTTLATPVDTLEVVLLPPKGGQVAVGKRTLTAADASYADCETCIVIRTKCDENLSNCAKAFMPTSGTVDITAFSGKTKPFEATVNANLVEVTIDDKNVTKPVAGGQTWCLSGLKVSVPSMQ
ncbi:MAG: hypothetical protein U0183_35315 [Polyangiaceae bacterium]